DCGRALGQLECNIGIARSRLDDRSGQVFVEVLPQAVRPQIERVDRETTPEHPVLPKVVGHSHARLEVVHVAAGERSGGVQQSSLLARQRVDRSGVEPALLPVLGLIWAFRLPAYAKVQRQPGGYLP